MLRTLIRELRFTDNSGNRRVYRIEQNTKNGWATFSLDGFLVHRVRGDFKMRTYCDTLYNIYGSKTVGGYILETVNWKASP